MSKNWDSLPVGAADPGLKTSPCIMNLNNKQVNCKHLLFKTSFRTEQQKSTDREGTYLENCWHSSVTQKHLGTRLYFHPTSPSSVEFLHHCNINDDTLNVLSFLTERPFGVTPLLSPHSNSESAVMDSH